VAHEQLEEWAIARGRMVAVNIVDDAYTGQAPKLHALLEACRTGRANEVAVWGLERLGASTIAQLRVMRELQALQVRLTIASVNFEIHPQTGIMNHILVFATVFLAAQKFLTKERIHSGHEEARRVGKRVGRPKSTRRPDPTTVAVLRNGGASWPTIAGILDCSVAAARRAYPHTRGADNDENDR